MLERSDVSQALLMLTSHEGGADSSRHCTLVELEAYHRQLLAEEEHEEVADHLSLCGSCSALLLYAVIAPDGGEEAILGEDAAAEIKGAWHRFRASLAKGNRSPDLEAEIDRCYEELLDLARSKTPEGSGAIDRILARLRTLQHREAAGYRQQFESNLRMPPNAGARIIARAGALREKLEDLVASDLSAKRAGAT